jgi:hypothetical protein
LQILIRLGATALITFMFYLSNQHTLSLVSDVFGILSIIALFQVVVMNFLLGTNYKRMRLMVDQGQITDEYDRQPFIYAAVRGLLVSFGIFAFYYLPVLLAIPWMRGLAYGIAFLLTLWFVHGYIVKRGRLAEIRTTAQEMMYAQEMSTMKPIRK